MKDLLKTYKGLCKFSQLIIIFILPPIIYGGIIGNILAIPLSTAVLFCIYEMKIIDGAIVRNILMLACCYIIQKIMLEFSGISTNEGFILSAMKVAMFILLIAREYLKGKIRDLVEVHVMVGHGKGYCNHENPYPKCVGECNHPTGVSYAEGFYVLKDGEMEEVEKL